MSKIEKTLTEKAADSTRNAIKGTKIVENENSTGISFFEGKKRLLKILKSKKALSIEVNVGLDAETEKLFGIEKISRKTAHEKHLGTMKYLVKITDEKLIPTLLKSAVENFKAELIAEKAKQDSEAV